MVAFRSLKYNSFAIAASASLSLLAAGCANTPPKSENYIAPKPGSTVDYRATNTGSFGNGTSVVTTQISESTWKGEPVLRYDSPFGSTLNNAQAGAVAVLDSAGRPVMQFEPALGYQWPLSLGKTWESEHTITMAAGNKYPMKALWKVEAYEDVTVPAGTFKAWRVTMSDNLGFRQTSWAVPQKLGIFAKRLSERSAAHPQGAGTQLFEMTKVPTMR